MELLPLQAIFNDYFYSNKSRAYFSKQVDEKY